MGRLLMKLPAVFWMRCKLLWGKAADAALPNILKSYKCKGCCMKKRIHAICLMSAFLFAGCSRFTCYDPQIYQEPTATEVFRNEEACSPNILQIGIEGNREGEQVFTISIEDYIENYNSFYRRNNVRDFFSPVSEWQYDRRETGIHSDHEMKFYYFQLDEKVYSLPTVAVYVPTNVDRIQEITVNFDQHSFTEYGFQLYKEMCCYTMKIFFPDLTDEERATICSEIISLGNQNILSSEEWYDKGAVPCVLFHADGIGVYPYFAVGDWDRFCVIPVTEDILSNFTQKGVKIYEIP